MSKLAIRGLGHYAPDNKISNDDLSKIMDTNDEWITTRTGIKTRSYAKNDENTSYMAFKACQMAIESAQIDISQIDIIICATFTADDFTPSVACKLLEYFNLSNVMAFDLNSACSGFVYALNTAAALLDCNKKRYALVVGAEKLSKILDFSDRSTAILFGDGAGAAVVESVGDEAYFYCMAKPDETHCLYAKGIESVNVMENAVCNDFFLRMNGQDVFRFALTSIEDGIESVLKLANLTLDDIKYIIPHQANIRIIQSVARKMKLPMEKFFMNLDHYGNTSAASVPIALSEAYHSNKIKKGDKVLVVGFGSGLSWASSIITI